MIQPFEEKLEEIGFMSPEINFSGFGSQGDGASFMCGDIEVYKLAEHLKLGEDFLKRLYIALQEGNVEARIDDLGGRHNHEHTKRFVFDEYTQDFIVETMQEKAEVLRVELCKEVYSNLSKWYDGITSDEELTEFFEANDHYYFNADTLEMEMDA